MDTSKRIETHWELIAYDVWGNREDGYEVNDKYTSDSDYIIMCKVERNNAGTPNAFDSAYPSDYAIKQAFGVSCAIECNGDDTIIYVDRASDSYPIGELRLISHDSLSPIHAMAQEQLA